MRQFCKANRVTGSSLAVGLMLMTGCGKEAPAPAAVNSPEYVSPVLQQPILQRPTKLQDSIANAPAWGPTPEMKAVLSNQAVVIGPYNLPVPNGYAAEEIDLSKMLGGMKSPSKLFQIKSPQQGAVLASLDIHVSPKLPIGDTNLDGITLRHRQQLDSQFTEITSTEPEVGKISGLAFSRFTWRGKFVATNEFYRGVQYAAFDGDWELDIAFKAGENDTASLGAFESAALSFLRK